MKRGEVDLESPKLRENPFELPADYFSDLMDSISSRISVESDQKAGADYGLAIGINRRGHLFPRIAYAIVISVLLVVGYITISPFGPDKTVPESALTEIDIIESGFLYTSFIDFFDDGADISEAIIDEEDISDEEIISFLSENAGIMLLASLD